MPCDPRGAPKSYPSREANLHDNARGFGAIHPRASTAVDAEPRYRGVTSFMRNAERTREYMKAYRQRPEVKARERARKQTPEYKARKAEYMRDYQAWNRFRLSGYEQMRRAAVRERALIASGEFGEPVQYSDSSIFRT